MFSTNDIDKRMQKCYNMCTYPYADFALFWCICPCGKWKLKSTLVSTFTPIDTKNKFTKGKKTTDVQQSKHTKTIRVPPLDEIL